MVNVIFSEDTNSSGTSKKRVAKIDGMFYPYNFSLETGQVTYDNCFANHSELGIIYVSSGYDTLEKAKRKLKTI